MPHKRPTKREAPPKKGRSPFGRKTVRTFDRRGGAHYRGPDGKFRKREQWERGGKWTQVEGEAVQLGEARLQTAAPVEAPRHPSGRRVKALTLMGFEIPRKIEDNATEGGDTFIIWQGRTYRVPMSRSGRVADLFRAMLSRYAKRMKGRKESGGFAFTVPMLEADAGDVIDLDGADFMADELADEFEGDDAMEQGILDLRGYMEDTMNDLTE